MNKLTLPNVTLAIVDCVDLNRAKQAVDHCLRLCTFGDVKILTDVNQNDSRIQTIDKISSIEEYSKFIIKDLAQYIQTDFVLIIQHDGFIWMPHMWSDVFLQYDYIGAPWPVELLKPGVPPYYNVGNGGFSLRSKKLQDFLAQDDNIQLHFAEDVAICQLNRQYLESKGFTFAPSSIAKNFSWECMQCEPAFGSHGRIRLS